MSEVLLSEAKDGLRQVVLAGKGAKCPCCDQWTQMYRWSMYATAAQLLIFMWKAGGTRTFVESKAVKPKNSQGDASRLRHWDLAEEEKKRRPDGGKSGWWRVTPLGELFVLDQITIPKYVWVYDGRVLRVEGEQVSIRDALGKKFNYDDMMGGEM